MPARRRNGSWRNVRHPRLHRSRSHHEASRGRTQGRRMVSRLCGPRTVLIFMFLESIWVPKKKIWLLSVSQLFSSPDVTQTKKSLSGGFSFFQKSKKSNCTLTFFLFRLRFLYRALLYISIITHPPTPPPPSLKKRHGRKFAASNRPQTHDAWCRDWNLRDGRRA